MPKKNFSSPTSIQNYEFCMVNKRAYRYPDGWTSKEKLKFGRLSAAEKLKACLDGGGEYLLNGLPLQLMIIPSNLFKEPDAKTDTSAVQ